MEVKVVEVGLRDGLQNEAAITTPPVVDFNKK